MAVQSRISARKTLREGVAFTGGEFDRMVAWADARGLQDELFYVVVEQWARSKQH
jgi:hypothetical protein